MIADGDSVARNAFRVGLLAAARDGDTPLPVNTTQELDPSDILEVRDMAEAIARAEQLVAAPRSSRPVSRRNAPADIFESLGRRPTDDTAGPATPAPAATAGLLLRPLSVTRTPTPVPVALPPVPVAQPVAEMVLSLPVSPPIEDDAYFHPAGRIRSLAEVTLDGYRPEPTLLLRARARRKSFSWILGAILLPVAVLAAIAILGRQESAATAATSTTTIATATIVTTATAPAAPKVQPPPPVAVAATAKPVTTTAPPSVPVFDVNSLPTAGSRGGKTRR